MLSLSGVASLSLNIAQYMLKVLCALLQEDPQVFEIDSAERPRRKRINTLQKERDTGSSGYQRVPPEPLEMLEKKEESSESQ